MIELMGYASRHGKIRYFTPKAGEGYWLMAEWLPTFRHNIQTVVEPKLRHRDKL